MKVPPVLNAAVEIIPNSSPSYVFTFIDNPDWRNNIFSIRVENYSSYEELLSMFVIREGKLTSTGFILGGANWVLRVKATGYEDSLVPIVIN